MSTLNREHVEFALKLWGEAKKMAWLPLRLDSQLENGQWKYYDQGNFDHYITIDLDFLREVPIDKMDDYIEALCENLELTNNPDIVGWTYNDLVILHNATIARRLEAILKSQGGE